MVSSGHQSDTATLQSISMEDQMIMLLAHIEVVQRDIDSSTLQTRLSPLLHLNQRKIAMQRVARLAKTEARAPCQRALPQRCRKRQYQRKWKIRQTRRISELPQSTRCLPHRAHHRLHLQQVHPGEEVHRLTTVMETHLALILE